MPIPYFDTLKLDKKWIIKSLIGVSIAYVIYVHVLHRFKVNVYFNGERLDDPNSMIVGTGFIWGKNLFRAFISLHLGRQLLNTVTAFCVLMYKIMMWRPSDMEVDENNNRLQYGKGRRASEQVIKGKSASPDHQIKKLRMRKMPSPTVTKQPFYRF